ncbi:hypothetical protein LMH87_004929 [Akanthomyces muscarius]|uniref:FAD-binding PCMH-type domain-containing protein n=1 Tax=Akanthomyces muscarius TaxID=2231603 RepID=A0A9W8QKT5_AKAMU|nr:hypothetical protein LMH87_004929 [Akanthomyces muscarius]KAJ4163185.1 hypothetical protein LMH87_004929 [Akanthomyces muscarius]
MLSKLLALLAAAFPLFVTASSDCKCTPRDSCWPSDFDWQHFNATINGRLIKAHPAASVCYESQPDYNEAACSTIRDQWRNSTFHGQDPISIDYPFLANNTCPPTFPNGTSVSGDPNAGSKGCALGGYPDYVIDATSAEVIATALKWAQRKRIRVVIKNSGHSHLGRSTGYGSLSIWTRNIKKVEYIESFQSASCKSNFTHKAASIGAGEVGIDVNRALDKHGAVIVAGANPSVGIVGWFTGGGHGPLSSDYGMGSDNLLEATLITPNGTTLTVNACQHSDLFYALRGGGGGTYGVVTSAVMKAYASPRTTLWSFSINLLDQTKESQWWDLMVFFHSQLPAWKEAGMQGYYYVMGPPFMKSRMLVGGFYIVHTASSFMEIYGPTQNEEVGTGGFSLGSRLLPAEPLKDTKAMRTLLRELSGASSDGTTSIPVAVIIGHVIANSNNAGLETGLNSAWRKAVVHFLIVGGWEDGAPDSVATAVRDDVTNSKTYAMRKLAPDSGAYFNEMDINEPNWQYTAFGSNYPRLRAVKKKYDPEGLLWCTHCVGSEEWVPNDSGQLCRPSWFGDSA